VLKFWESNPIFCFFVLESKSNVTKSPVKKSGCNSKVAARKSIGKAPPGIPIAESMNPIIPEEQRKCSFDGCDSKGHLGGHFEKHFTLEACPMYHNKTPEQCKVSTERSGHSKLVLRLQSSGPQRNNYSVQFLLSTPFPFFYFPIVSL